LTHRHALDGLAEQIAQIVVGMNVVWVKGEGTFVVLHGFIDSASR
jgi:hypothetical protein